VLGAHVEGPFLNPDHRGAHDDALMLDPTAERLARWLQCPPRMLSPDPPIVLGLAGTGRIVAAALADLVLLAPDLGVRLTLVAGEVAFRS
jgi:N-acetylglucosamine-6-phosphate deacetylase